MCGIYLAVDECSIGGMAHRTYSYRKTLLFLLFTTSILASTVTSKAASSSATSKASPLLGISNTSSLSGTSKASVSASSILVVGGYNPPNHHKSVVVLGVLGHPQCDVPSLPLGVYGHSSAVIHEGVITCGGETVQGTTESCWIWMVNSTRWRPAPALPSSVYRGGMVAVGGDLIWAGGRGVDMDTWILSQEAVEKAVQQEAVEKAVQQEAVEKTVQQEAVEKAVQQEAVEKTVQQEAVEKVVHHEAVEKAVQQEAVEKPVQQEAVEKAVQQEAVENAVQHGRLGEDGERVVQQWKWVKGPQLLDGRHSHCTVAFRGMAVVTGGENNGDALATVEGINATARVDLPALRRGRTVHGCAAFVNKAGKEVIIVAGGWTGRWPAQELLSSVETLLEGAGTWTVMEAQLPEPRRLFSMTADPVSARIYVIGGYYGETINSTLVSGDEGKTWEEHKLLEMEALTPPSYFNLVKSVSSV